MRKIPFINLTLKGFVIIVIIAVLISYLFSFDSSIEPVKEYVRNNPEVIKILGSVEDVKVRRIESGPYRRNKDLHMKTYYITAVGENGRLSLSVYVEYDRYNGIRDNNVVNIGTKKIGKLK